MTAMLQSSLCVPKGRNWTESIAGKASRIGADIVQLHSASGAPAIDDLRRQFRGKIWAVISIDPDSRILPPEANDLAETADALLLDARVGGRSGGTGRTLNWGALIASVGALNDQADLVLAGGLTPENVATAIRTMRPEVVDAMAGMADTAGRGSLFDSQPPFAPAGSDTRGVWLFRDAQEVPEPSTLLLMGVGALSVMRWRAHRDKRSRMS